MSVSGSPAKTPARLPLREAIEALTEGLAMFDANGELAVCNNSFHTMNPMLSDILKPGMPWAIFLIESAHRGAFPRNICTQLELMENRLDGAVDATSTVITSSAQGTPCRFGLTATSDGGFLITQTLVVDPDLDNDSATQADLLLSKVLEACPANLTMSRIGDGQVLYRSPSATSLLGKSRNSFDHFAKREDRADFVTALLPNGVVDDMHFTGLYPHGQEFPAKISAQLIDYHGEDVIVANITDLSNEIAMQRSLEQQRDQLYQSEKLSALGELLAGVAHELNNPLSIVVGNADMLREDATDPAMLRRVQKISEASERCIRIVRSFLAMARDEPMNFEKTDLAELMSIADTALHAGETNPGVAVVIDAPQDIPALKIDPVQVTQVVINLITNARQAIETSGVGDTVTVSSRFDPVEKMVILRVGDNGPGIPDTIKNRIFDPLFTTKDFGKGTGVGLAFCLRIIASHNGQIRLMPNQGQGAVFEVVLPIWR